MLHTQRLKERQGLHRGSAVTRAFRQPLQPGAHPASPMQGQRWGNWKRNVEMFPQKTLTRIAQAPPHEQWYPGSTRKCTCLSIRCSRLEPHISPLPASCPREAHQEGTLSLRTTTASATGKAAGCPDPGRTHRGITDRRAQSPDFPWKQGGSLAQNAPGNSPTLGALPPGQ